MSWKVTLPCTRAEAESLGADISPFAAMDAPPALVTREAEGGGWRLDAYFDEKPGRDDLKRLSALVPSAGDAKPAVEHLPEEDWLTLSQAGLEPIRAGRFYVHTPEHRGGAPDDAVAFQIPAGLAFGTGQHETTAGCLLALDRLRRRGFRARNLIDVGTGTGLLAFAALHLWPAARAVASDIDSVAVAVTRENAGRNAVPLGRGPGRLEALTAPGVEHPRIQARAPYDLILANILAGPLIELAPRLSVALAPGGRLILAGLLHAQANRVAQAYQRQGLRLVSGAPRGDWPCLVLRRPLIGWTQRGRTGPRRAQRGWALTC